MQQVAFTAKISVLGRRPLRKLLLAKAVALGRRTKITFFGVKDMFFLKIRDFRIKNSEP